MEGFCPRCFAPMDADAGVCPACGLQLERWNAKNYSAKLIHALRHPLSEIRMRAIIAIGLRRDSRAADALVWCAFQHPTDVIEGLEIVRSLGQMEGSASAQEALRKITARHPAHAVRVAAGEESTAEYRNN